MDADAQHPGRRAGAYVRISSDPTGRGLGVARQEEACRRRAADLGWEVVRLYRDNDVSASTGKPRPAYERMLADVENGLIDAVIVWDLDRLTRRPIEIEHFIDLADRRALALASCSGDVDLLTDNGRLFARIKGAVARAEVERKGARQRAANEQRAASGRPPGGRRCFGYTTDGMQVVAAEAKAYRDAVNAILTGGTVRGITREWQQAGILTTAGNPWGSTEVRRLLLNPRHAGIHMYRGQRSPVPGVWPPLIDEDTHAQVVAVLSAPDRHRRGRPFTYLLSGVARCGICGARMYGRSERRRRIYVCSGAAHLSRKVDTLEAYVESYLLSRLETGAFADALADTHDGGRLADLRAEEATLTQRLAALAEAFADGAITRAQLTGGTARLRGRLDAIAREVPALVSHPALSRLLTAGDARAEWAHLSVEVRREVVGLLLSVTVFSPGRGARNFDPTTVRVERATRVAA